MMCVLEFVIEQDSGAGPMSRIITRSGGGGACGDRDSDTVWWKCSKQSADQSYPSHSAGGCGHSVITEERNF